MKPKPESPRLAPACFLGGILLAFCCAACSTEAPTAAEAPPAQPGFETASWLHLQGLRARIYKGTELESYVLAEKASVDVKTETAVLDGVEAVFYEHETPTGRLVSQKGELLLKDRPGGQGARNDLLLSGGVVLEAREVSFSCPALHYFSQEGKIISSGGSFEQRMHTGDYQFTVTGGWFAADRNFLDFEYHENPRLAGAPADRQTKGTSP